LVVYRNITAESQSAQRTNDGDDYSIEEKLHVTVSFVSLWLIIVAV
jgi:hypothetical protein